MGEGLCCFEGSLFVLLLAIIVIDTIFYCNGYQVRRMAYAVETSSLFIQAFRHDIDNPLSATFHFQNDIKKSVSNTEINKHLQHININSEEEGPIREETPTRPPYHILVNYIRVADHK